MSQFRFGGEITLTNRGIKTITTLRYDKFGQAMLDLDCHISHRIQLDEAKFRQPVLGVYLGRVYGNFARRRPDTLCEIPGETRQSQSRPIFCYIHGSQSSLSTFRMSTLNSRRLFIDLQFAMQSASRLQSEIYDVRPVPEARWHDDWFFSLHGLSEMTGFVRFSISTHIEELEGRVVTYFGTFSFLLLFTIRLPHHPAKVGLMTAYNVANWLLSSGMT
jgi:hypothetical protein